MTASDGPAQPNAEIEVLDAVRTMFRRDSLYMVIGSLQTVLALLVTPVLTHILGVGAFGQVATASALLQVLVAVANLALQVAVQRTYFTEDGRRRAQSLVAAGLVVAAVVTVITFFSAPWWAPVLGFRHQTALIEVVILYGGASAATQLGLALLRCSERMKIYFAVSALQSVGGQLLGIAILLAFHRMALLYVIGLAAAQGGALIITLVLAPPRWQGRAALKRTREALRFSIPLVPQQVAGFVIVASDRLVVQRYKGSVAVGRYQVAYNVGSLAIILLTLLSGAWTARIFSIKNDADRHRVIATTRDTLFRLLLPVTLGIGFGSGLVLRYWVPSTYHIAGLPMIVALVDVATFPAWSAASSQRALLALGRTKDMALSTGTAATLNLVLNVILVPHLGILGSAIATLLSYVAQMILSAALAQRVGVHQFRSPPGLLVAIVAVGAATVATGLVPLTPLGTWVRVAGSVACLSALGWGFRRPLAHGRPHPHRRASMPTGST
jgi:O-antigen/teichoic acid export membrane protein